MFWIFDDRSYMIVLNQPFCREATFLTCILQSLEARGGKGSMAGSIDRAEAFRQRTYDRAARNAMVHSGDGRNGHSVRHEL